MFNNPVKRDKFIIPSFSSIQYFNLRMTTSSSLLNLCFFLLFSLMSTTQTSNSQFRILNSILMTFLWLRMRIFTWLHLKTFHCKLNAEVGPLWLELDHPSFPGHCRLIICNMMQMPNDGTRGRISVEVGDTMTKWPVAKRENQNFLNTL